MTIAYRRRKKAIRAEKHRLMVNFIDMKTFTYLQAKWHSKITGPPIGTLEDLMNEQLT